MSITWLYPQLPINSKWILLISQLDFVEEIWLFGSRARGDNLPRSDIDIAIVSTYASDYDWMKIIDIVDEADTLLKIDCVRFDKNKISSELYENILRDRKILYKNVKETTEA